MGISNTNISPCKCNYLDLTISIIYKGQFIIVRLYDKRTYYPCYISYPDLDGNIPCNLMEYSQVNWFDFVVLLLAFLNIFRRIRNWLINLSTKDLIMLYDAIDVIGFVRVKLVLLFLFLYRKESNHNRRYVRSEVHL